MYSAKILLIALLVLLAWAWSSEGSTPRKAMPGESPDERAAREGSSFCSHQENWTKVPGEGRHLFWDSLYCETGLEEWGAAMESLFSLSDPRAAIEIDSFYSHLALQPLDLKVKAARLLSERARPEQQGYLRTLLRDSVPDCRLLALQGLKRLGLVDSLTRASLLGDSAELLWPKDTSAHRVGEVARLLMRDGH